MQGGGNVFAPLQQLIESIYCFCRVEGYQFDVLVLEDLPGLLRDLKYSGSTTADDQDRRLGRDYGLQIFGSQQVSLFSPPVGVDGITEDETVTVVCRPVDDSVSKSVRINVHSPASLRANASRFNVVYQLVLTP